jgi:hypothetical protein
MPSTEDPTSKSTPKKGPHIEVRQFSTDEIARASAENAITIILPACACGVKAEVFGKLLIL